ncbi:hypothetical protein Trydic_g8902 [Trypoxylus dichotomus]
MKGKCLWEFHEKMGTLAHAFHPVIDNCVEIHLDAQEDWYMGEGAAIGVNQISLLSVLIHEIGHALGLKHSNDE